MKKILFTIASCFCCMAFAQRTDLLNEKFDGGLPSGWTHNSSNWGTNVIWSASGGAARDNSGPYFGPVSNWLQAPAVNLSKVSEPTLEFDVAIGSSTDTMQLSVWYSTGGNWTILDSYGASFSRAQKKIAVKSIPLGAWTAAAGDYQHILIDLSSLNQHSGIRFSFGADFMNAYAQGAFFIDNIRISGTPITSGLADAGSERSSFIVYPNPAEGRIHLAGISGSSSCPLVITDLLGRVVHEQSLVPTEAIDVSHLPAGLYRIRYETTGGILSSGLVIR